MSEKKYLDSEGLKKLIGKIKGVANTADSKISGVYGSTLVTATVDEDKNIVLSDSERLTKAVESAEIGFVKGVGKDAIGVYNSYAAGLESMTLKPYAVAMGDSSMSFSNSWNEIRFTKNDDGTYTLVNKSSLTLQYTYEILHGGKTLFAKRTDASGSTYPDFNNPVTLTDVKYSDDGASVIVTCDADLSAATGWKMCCGAYGYSSVSIGPSSVAIGNHSLCTGPISVAIGLSSVSVGVGSYAYGEASFAEGEYTSASEAAAHSEGLLTQATGIASHAEGNGSTATGRGSHSEGNQSRSNGGYSHAEGQKTVAIGVMSHTEGNYTVANNRAEHAEGQYNVSNTLSGATYGSASNTQHSVGIGTSDTDRKNAFEIMQNGDMYVYGVGNYVGTEIKTSANTVKTIQDLLTPFTDDEISEIYARA